jgi:phosphomannomutase
MHELIARAERWIQDDPDSVTRAELGRILDAARAGDKSAERDLTERFSGPLAFGTAGLRGVLGAGESRMNRAVVLRTTAGLAAYLLAHADEASRSRGVVVGYDGRHMSREFAVDTACALAAVGLKAHLSPRPCPTPLTAFAVTDLGAASGIMVTASHNPPEYNGYKVYWDNGAQIIPPHDEEIARAIDSCPPANEVPLHTEAQARGLGLLVDLSDDVEERYLAAIRALSVQAGGDGSMPIVYTPLHGVGNRLVHRAMAAAGFTGLVTVPEQAEPDGDFPTVRFPNPEEPGAMDLSFSLAERVGADLVLANDPDVDRLAVAVRDPQGRYVQLTGNQVGVLLGHYLLTEGKHASEDRTVLASLVSSPMLGAVAAKLGVRYEETLTGFKWIANRAMELEREVGTRFVFGYEEALGYTVGSVVRDKDGISAAQLMAELAAVRRAQGKTLLDELDVLSRRYGIFVSGQRAVTFRGTEGVARIARIMSELRRIPPTHIGKLGVAAVRDLLAGTRTERGKAPERLALHASDVLVYELDGKSRVIARPSGTEPKIKFYFDVCEPVAEGEALGPAQARAEASMAALTRAFCALTGVEG